MSNTSSKPPKKKKGNLTTKLDEFKFTTLPKEIIAWLAGLFQAEAYFHLDRRVRSKAPISEYTPVPPRPQIKLEMIEKDLMHVVADYVGEDVIEVARRTTANNIVYRITLTQRKKVEAFLKCLQPYIIGEKTNSKITELLKVCEEYNTWEAAGGKNNAAKYAARAKAKQAPPLRPPP